MINDPHFQYSLVVGF